MKMFLISDNIDTYTGMRLAGVEGVVVHERKELKEALDKVLADKEIGIVLLTEKFGREFPDVINHAEAVVQNSPVCGDPRPPRNRPQAQLYHRLRERSHRPETIEKAGDRI